MDIEFEKIILNFLRGKTTKEQAADLIEDRIKNELDNLSQRILLANQLQMQNKLLSESLKGEKEWN